MSALAGVVAKQDESIRVDKGRDRGLVLWQRRMLPFMTWFIVAMAATFFCFTAIHLYRVTAFIETEHGQDIRALIEGEVGKPNAEEARSSEDVLRRSLLLLEADALDKRYHQASAMLMSRIWSRQLAFVTGMVLAFVGAVFILGKLSEASSEISGGASEWKVAITSASPGIILSFFGTVLLVSSLFVPATPLDVTDGPAYLGILRSEYNASPAASPETKPQEQTQPLGLDELEKLGKQKGKTAAKH